MTVTEKIDRRFLEEHFPVKEVSEESVREKGIRRGHISTIHIWWARRPLSSSRAVSYAALVPISETKEQKKIAKFVAKLSKWESISDVTVINKARSMITRFYKGNTPKILDPFAGGGAIPLESLRLGCDTYASDYNPVATLILKCTLEYPGRYSDQSVNLEKNLISKKKGKLLEDVKKWGTWVLDEVKTEIASMYPCENGGTYPIGYIWANTVPCQNPSCNAEIPLMRQFWLARKNNRKIAVYPEIVGKNIEFQIVGTGYKLMPKNFDPNKGIVSRAIATCPVCGSVVDSQKMRSLFQTGKSGQRMVVVILRKKTPGKLYRVANKEDIEIFNKAESLLENKQKLLTMKWGINPVPDEPTPEGKGSGAERAFSLRNYGMNQWGDLFNSRQKLTLVTFAEKVRLSYEKMVKSGYDKEYAKAIVSYLALNLSKIVDWNNVIATWLSYIEKLSHAFTRQVLQMTWDYCENVPIYTTSGSWGVSLNVLTNGLNVYPTDIPGRITVSQSSATDLNEYNTNFFDAVFTDPPYYDNVPYSFLSDFFYVWLKRTIGHLYPELFSTPLTPKSKEIVAYSNREGGLEGGKKFFEEMLNKSFKEINRVLKPNGIAVIVYAHKSAAGWETLINSLLDSGLVITAAWPIHTEMKMRLRAMESAALGSSIYIVARKIQKIKIGLFKDVKEELEIFLNKKMDILWKEGISGADFLISAIGASVMIFGKYEKILRETDSIRADVMLEEVRRIVTNYAVKQVLHNGFASEISNLTRFYLLWRWSYGGATLPFDDARKLAQSTMIDLSHEWNKTNSFIKKKKQFVSLLGPQDRDIEAITSVDKKDLIDVLHMALLLWQKGDRQALVDLVSETGFGSKDYFYRVAQAISETLPKESQEKKLIEGFLAGKERLSSET
ncbi:MAG: DUF1156 domain-containing protein, partial [Candidatus Bathyarchaeota archaeon]|nr:DUF1156 domain-containing protein [Candidatus Bathyarchaeum sp.]